MSADGQRTKWRRNVAENFNQLSRVRERYTQTDRQTNGRRHIANVNVSLRSLKINRGLLFFWFALYSFAVWKSCDAVRSVCRRSWLSRATRPFSGFTRPMRFTCWVRLIQSAGSPCTFLHIHILSVRLHQSYVIYYFNAYWCLIAFIAP